MIWHPRQGATDPGCDGHLGSANAKPTGATVVHRAGSIDRRPSRESARPPPRIGEIDGRSDPRRWPCSNAHLLPDRPSGAGPTEQSRSPSSHARPGGTADRSSMSPITPTTGVGSMFAPALVVEAHVAADHREVEAPHASAMPSTASLSCHITWGVRGCRS